MKSSLKKRIRRWLILARGKFSPPRTEGANFEMCCIISSRPLRGVPPLCNFPPLSGVPIFLLILFTVPACKQPTAPDPKPEFSFTIEDASCTEAWINIKTTAYGSGFSFALNRNDSTVLRFAALPPDTIIVDEGLLPNKEYTYELLAISSKTAPISAGKKKVTTMDTTSHNFTWQTWEFGDIGSSVLYDVAIIDENNIWAVGEISIRDSSHNGYTTYNAVHWDGVKWELKRILFPTVCGSTDRTAFPSRSIIYLQNGIIWAGSSGDKIAVMKDNIQVNQFCLPTSLQMGINKMWGTSDKDVYAVGNSGNIAHYDGVSWKKIESGTDTNLKDVYGTPDGEIVWISGYQDFKPTVLLKISNSIIETVFNSLDYLFVFDPEHLSGGIESVWTNSNNFVYVTTWYSLYRKSIYIDPAKEEALKIGNPLNAFGSRSRGTDINNIFTIGYRNTIHHFNGITFKTHAEPAVANVTYNSLDVKINRAVLCGQKYDNGISDKAVITIIKYMR